MDSQSDDFSALLLYQHQDQGGNSASLFRANVFDKGSNKLNDNYKRDTVCFDGGNNNPAKIKSFGVTLKLDWDVGDHTITSITSYQDIYDRFARGDIDGGYGCLLSLPAQILPAGATWSVRSAQHALSTRSRHLSSLTWIPAVIRTVEQITQEIRIASNLDGPFNYQVGSILL